MGNHASPAKWQGVGTASASAGRPTVCVALASAPPFDRVQRSAPAGERVARSSTRATEPAAAGRQRVLAHGHAGRLAKTSGVGVNAVSTRGPESEVDGRGCLKQDHDCPHGPSSVGDRNCRSVVHRARITTAGDLALAHNIRRDRVDRSLRFQTEARSSQRKHLRCLAWLFGHSALR